LKRIWWTQCEIPMSNNLLYECENPVDLNLELKLKTSN
jgi:hypothetical protein